MKKRMKIALISTIFIGNVALAESPTVTERGTTDNGGYVIWSDGYKEAWGQYHKGSSLYNTDIISVSLPFTLSQPNKAYADGNLLGRQGNGNGTVVVIGVNSNTADFGPDGSHVGTLEVQSFTWTVKGY